MEPLRSSVCTRDGNNVKFWDNSLDSSKYVFCVLNNVDELFILLRDLIFLRQGTVQKETSFCLDSRTVSQVALDGINSNLLCYQNRSGSFTGRIKRLIFSLCFKYVLFLSF